MDVSVPSQGGAYQSRESYNSNAAIEREETDGEDLADRHDDIADEEQLHFSWPRVSLGSSHVRDYPIPSADSRLLHL